MNSDSILIVEFIVLFDLKMDIFSWQYPSEFTLNLGIFDVTIDSAWNFIVRRYTEW